MACQAVMGHSGKWAMAASNATPSTTTFSGATVSYPVVSDTVGLSNTIGYSRGLRGTRGQVVEGSRTNLSDVNGTIVFEASPMWLAFIIPHITGDASTPFILQETMGDGFDYVRYDGIAGKSRMFRNCLINQATLTFHGEFVSVALDIVALSETEVTYAGAVLASTVEWEPYIPAEFTLNAGNPAANRLVETCTLTINNALQARRRMKLLPQCFLPGIRTVTLNTDAEWGATSEAQMYGQDEGGFAATLTLTRTAEGLSSVIALEKLQIPDHTPGITGPDEIMYPIAGVARAAGGSSSTELNWVNDSTPV